MNEGYKLPELRTPFAILKEGHPYGHWLEDGRPARKREATLKVVVTLAQIIAVIGAIIAIAYAIALCTVPAHASAEGDDFPSYWQMDIQSVKQAQNALIKLGYKPNTNGRFGAKTAQAVKEFQKNNRLATTGVIDEATAKLIGFKLETGRTLYYMANLSAIAKKTTGKWLIYIAMGGRSGISHIGVFKKGDTSWKLVKSEDCVADSSTSLGRYTIAQKMSAKTTVKEGMEYTFRNFLKLKGGSAITATPQLDGKTVKTATSPEGYVNVSYKLSKWLYKQIPLGATVVIDDRAWQPADL